MRGTPASSTPCHIRMRKMDMYFAARSAVLSQLDEQLIDLNSYIPGRIWCFGAQERFRFLCIPAQVLLNPSHRHEHCNRRESVH